MHNGLSREGIFGDLMAAEGALKRGTPLPELWRFLSPWDLYRSRRFHP